LAFLVGVSVSVGGGDLVEADGVVVVIMGLGAGTGAKDVGAVYVDRIWVDVLFIAGVAFEMTW